MSSVKLSEHLRKVLCRAILEHRFKADEEKLGAEWAEFGESVYEDLYPPAVRKQMAALPPGWLPEEKHLQAKFGAAWEEVTFPGARRCADKHVRHCAKVYAATHPLAERHEELHQRRCALRTQRQERETEVRGVLQSATTTGRLLEIWPEVEPFLTALLPAATQNLPAPVTAQLNKGLNLPVETKKRSKSK